MREEQQLKKKIFGKHNPAGGIAMPAGPGAGG